MFMTWIYLLRHLLLNCSGKKIKVKIEIGYIFSIKNGTCIEIVDMNEQKLEYFYQSDLPT